MSARAVFAVLAFAVPPGALACGVCVEDKIAATYDHAIVTEAAARHHVVVFAGVDGPGVASEASQSLRQAAARVKGVDRGTVRAAESPRALSFALDPRVASPEAALAEISHAPALHGVRLSLIRVVR